MRAILLASATAAGFGGLLFTRETREDDGRPGAEAPGTGLFIPSAVAPIGPTPGICAKGRLQALARCQAISLASIAFSSACSRAYSLPSVANSSRASTGKF